jgi:hypothetical protein
MRPDTVMDILKSMRESSFKLRVICRIKPTKEEIYIAGAGDTVIASPEPLPSALTKPKLDKKLISPSASVPESATLFRFDKVLPPETKQAEVYDIEMQDSISSLLSGRNTCIITFGTTK